MLFYLHAGDAPLWVLILLLLFITLVPTAVILLAVFVIRDVMKWKKEKEKKYKKS
jgi:uncharacterized protein YybS (DUF2232 family)